MEKKKNLKLGRRKIITSQVLEDILKQNEKEANVFIAKVLLFDIVFTLIDFLIMGVEPNDFTEEYVYLFMISSIAFGGACSIFTILFKGKGANTKGFLLVSLVFLGFCCTAYSVHGYWCILYAPIILSVRYYDTFLTVEMGIISIITMVLSSIIGIYLGYFAHYIPLDAIDIRDTVNITISNGLTETLYDYGLVNPNDLLIQQLTYVAIYIFFYIVILIFSLGLVKVGKRSILKTADFTLALEQKEKDIKDAKMKVMISQLQPHFLYNSLSAIMAIDDNPPETIEALGEFSKYLRGNLDSLKTNDLIPFEQELEHVERYISLEKLRFGDKLNFIFDITVKNFKLPPLTLQMTIENAVKHGVFNLKEVGCITVVTREDEHYFYVKVIDNGVGFDTSIEKQDGKSHVGLSNSRKRIEFLCKGSYIVESEIGKGTTVLIAIPKLKENTL